MAECSEQMRQTLNTVLKLAKKEASLRWITRRTSHNNR